MKNSAMILKSPLFKGIKEAEAAAVLKCLAVTEREYSKGEYILRRGESISKIGIILEGSLLIVKEDFWGNRNILTKIGESKVFAEVFACMENETSNVDVVAAENAKVLFVDAAKIAKTCSNSCRFHTILIQNLMAVLAGKNLMLTHKLDHMMQRSTRGKILSYLSEQSRKWGSDVFTIPLDRQQFADYLSVDRSALSNELSKLRREGILECRKNQFKLKPHREEQEWRSE